MKKIIIAIIIIFSLILTNYMVENYLEKNEKIEEDKKRLLEKGELDKKLKEEETQKEKEKISKDIIDNKLKLLRKRYILRGLIQKGDIYLENEQNLLALKSYLGAVKQTPNDKVITKKIGDTYYQMKKFKIAYNYYKDLLGTDIVDSNKLAITYFHTLPIEKEKLDFNKIYKEIDKFNLEKEDIFFYKTSIECLFNKGTCQKKFEDYLKKGYKGKNKNILFIKKAFDDYSALQIKEQYFKDTQILAAIFKANLFGISNILSKDILKEMPDYLPVLKIISKGNYELGKFKDAKKYLLEYNKYDKNDPKVNYMLGVVNIKLQEYILSNIFFIRASKLGYKNKSDISRRLIYNYYLASNKVNGNKERMLLEFKKLIETYKDVNATDYSLGIYYSIISGKDKQANKWTDKAMILFPKNDNFYGYKGWIYKEANNLDKAEYYLMKGYKINRHNPLINLNLGIVEKSKGNLVKAKIYFKNTLSEDPNGEFGKFATKKLEEIFLQQEKLKKEIDENF